VVHSRTFGSAAKEGGVGVRMLVPLIDMLNHAGDEAQLLLDSPTTAMDNVRWGCTAPGCAEPQHAPPQADATDATLLILQLASEHLTPQRK
jgi:hypothetical protein